MKNSFDLYDYQQTVQSLAIYNRTKVQDVDDYILRKRKAELRLLVRKVIKNELSDLDKQLVELHWYKGKSKQEIANITGLDRSTVYRHFERINNTIYDKLKYAVEYRFGNDFSLKADVLIKSDVLRSGGITNIEKRIKYLREKNFLSVSDVSQMTGISENRLMKIERVGKEMTMFELKKISTFFKVSTDYLIYGKNTQTMQL